MWTIRQSLFWVGMNFNHYAVRPDNQRRFGHGRNKAPFARGMRRVDTHNRKMRKFFYEWNADRSRV